MRTKDEFKRSKRHTQRVSDSGCECVGEIEIEREKESEREGEGR